MNTPINFELAKLLKEKGYEQNPYKVANSYLPRYKDGSEIYLNNSLYAPEYNICTAPTITEVVMWLYERHGIWIWVEQEDTTNEFQWLCRYENKGCCKDYDDKFYNSPTEAYKAAIDYTLNNLL